MIDSTSLSLFLCKMGYTKIIINALLVSRSVTFQETQKLSSPGGKIFSFFLVCFLDIFEIPYELLTQIASAQLLIFPSSFASLIDSVSIYKRHLSALLHHSFLW